MILLLLIAFIVNDQLCVCFGMCSLNDNCIIFASVLLDKIILIELEIQWILLLQNLVLKFRTLKFLNYKFRKLKSEIFSIRLLTLILDQSREKQIEILGEKLCLKLQFTISTYHGIEMHEHFAGGESIAENGECGRSTQNCHQ